MKFHETGFQGTPAYFAAAGAIALLLAACDPQAPAGKMSKNFDGAAENAGRNMAIAEAPAESGTDSKPVAEGNAALAAKVKSALTTDPELKTLTVDVNAADGVVTLFGTADNAARSYRAAQVALNVDGVRSVKNELVIVRGS
jgi:hyperosmotically inducible periplasmic protein